MCFIEIVVIIELDFSTAVEIAVLALLSVPSTRFSRSG